MWGGNFKYAAIGNACNTVAKAGLDVKGGSGAKVDFVECFFAIAGHQVAITRFQEEGLFFDLVVLEAEAFAGADKEEFCDVVWGLRPNQFVSPGFVDFADRTSFFGQCNS